MTDPRPVVLVYRALGLGDLLTAVPALRALGRALPGHRRILAAPGSLRPLAALVGAVEEVVDCAPLVRLQGAPARPALAVDLHGRGPQSHRVLLELRPGRLIAFGCPEAGVAGPPWRAEEHEVARWCRLLEASGIPADPGDLALRAPSRALPDAWRGATVVHPGAASRARRWPPQRWTEVVASERAAGRRVVITGTRDERGLACRVAAAAELPWPFVAAGRTDLLDLAALVAGAGRVVCGDTGIAHLATALSTPSVVLFGPTPPRLWGPPPARRLHRSLWAGRVGDPEAESPDAGLLELEVKDVLAALDELAPRRSPAEVPA